MRTLAISAPLKPAERHFLRVLDQSDGEYRLASGLKEKLAAAALRQVGYAERHPVFPNHYRITPAGDRYLHQLARAY